jgi:hypothetical protein
MFTLYDTVLYEHGVLVELRMKLEIEKFDSYLEELDLTFEAIIIGGAALNIMDVITRQTKDVDFLDPDIPVEIKKASVNFALKNPDLKLDAKNWMNNGPKSLVRDLPEGWRNDLQKIFEGKALNLWTLGRLNLLRTKLYAYADREIDYSDCMALNPTIAELEACREWVLAGDGSELWPGRVDAIFQKLKEDLKLV